MFTIRNYTDTKCELEIAKTRLKLLMDDKEALYCKYFPMIKELKEIDVDGGTNENEQMNNYLHELHEIDIGTGKSLAQEIQEQQKEVNKLEYYISEMDNSLSKMRGLEYKLFYEIVYKGTNVTKAVENIAEISDKDTRTIWKSYYSKIKKDIKKLKKYSKSSV